MTDRQPSGPLGDTPERSYGDKLTRFNRFAEPEIREVIAGLDLAEGARVLDAGCGVGLIARWFAEQIGPGGSVVGIDLSHEHIAEAERLNAAHDLPLRFMQADLNEQIFGSGTFDLVWVSNTINHIADPVAALRRLAETLVEGGSIVLAQSAFLPEMFFAWDERLEREVALACRRYYREKYDLDERETAGMRRLYGWMLEAELTDVTARTIVIERTPPLRETDREYFQHGVFEGYWAHRVEPYLSPEDWAELQRLTTPGSSGHALDRPDFHHIQTFTVVSGRV